MEINDWEYDKNDIKHVFLPKITFLCTSCYKRFKVIINRRIRKNKDIHPACPVCGSIKTKKLKSDIDRVYKNS